MPSRMTGLSAPTIRPSSLKTEANEAEWGFTR